MGVCKTGRICIGDESCWILPRNRTALGPLYKRSLKSSQLGEPNLGLNRTWRILQLMCNFDGEICNLWVFFGATYGVHVGMQDLDLK